MRDTGSNACGVRADFVTKEQMLDKYDFVKTYTGKMEKVPLAKVKINTPYLTGELIVHVLNDPTFDCIIGNIEGALGYDQVDTKQWEIENRVGNVMTRFQRKRKNKNPLLNQEIIPDVTSEEVSRLQKDDITLKQYFDFAYKKVMKSNKHSTVRFFVKNNILYREYDSKENVACQICIPICLRPTILYMSNDCPLSAHQGIRRTMERIMSKFYWPGIKNDVKTYVKTCHVCQLRVQKGRVNKAPIMKMPVIENTMERVSIDLIGPILPCAETGERFILTMVDMTTRWVEAVSLRNVTSETVATALFSIFCRLSFPKEMLSDFGTQLTSDVMNEFCKLCGIKQIHSTIFHPESNGVVERMNGTIKMMLKKVMAENPKHWPKFIDPILFAYREMSHENLQFSPFELMFGRKPRGPLSILFDIYSGEVNKEEEKCLYEFISDLMLRIKESCRIAQENLSKALDTDQKKKNLNRKLRELKSGDKVLVLLPTDKRKLMLTWSGPYDVIERVSEVNYKIQVKGLSKIFHINMLKEYYERPEKLTLEKLFSKVNHVLVETEEKIDYEVNEVESLYDPRCPGDEFKLPNDVIDGCVHNDLSVIQKQEIFDLLKKHERIISNVPGKTSLIEHSIELTSNVPVFRRSYPLPLNKRQDVIKQVNELKELGVVEESISPYASPIVLVKKPDNTFRMCCDYRQLNNITVIDREPIPDIEELMCRLHKSNYFSKLDLTKGYWQIPLEKNSRAYTAFQTPIGLFQWCFMPMGLTNSCATFARMIRRLGLNSENTVAYFDDILIHTENWSEHVNALNDTFTILGKYGLTVKPSKLNLGYNSIEFLGHTVGEGVLKPTEEKISKILDIGIPNTKKQVKSLVALLSYYRKFIPNFSELTCVLSELTKKKYPNIVIWSEECSKALEEIKRLFSQRPILRLPDINRSFVLRTDASFRALGSCLFQEYNGVLHPVLYASRKLLEKEKKYPIIELEALAIVWSVTKFSKYLEAQQFVIECDHKPLKILKVGNTTNKRIQRWSLTLQQYDYEIKPISGKENVCADLLSRL